MAEGETKRASDGLWTGARILAALALFAYAYSFGYLVRIEPQFVSAFSLLDLILWSASSVIFLVIGAALSIVGAVATVFFVAGTTSDVSKVPEPPQEAEPTAEAARRKQRTLIEWLAGIYIVAFVIVAFVMPSSPAAGWPLARLAGVFLAPICAILVLAGTRHGKLVAISRRLLFYLATAALAVIAFLVGDYQGFEVRAGGVASRTWVCSNRSGGDCYPLLFLGSEKMVYAYDGRYIVRTLEDRHRIVSRGVPPYRLPERKQRMIEVGNRLVPVGF